MDDISQLTRTQKLAYKREMNRAQRQASSHPDTACFTYLFVMKEGAAMKVGISISPVARLRSLPQDHLRYEDVFDLERSVAIYAQRREDARKLEQAAKKKYSECRIDAPDGCIVYVGSTRTCTGPIRWSAGGKTEWLDSGAYDEVLNFLLLKDRDTPRPSISMGALIRGLQEFDVLPQVDVERPVSKPEETDVVDQRFHGRVELTVEELSAFFDERILACTEPTAQRGVIHGEDSRASKP
jgi:hypothetical protein